MKYLNTYKLFELVDWNSLTPFIADLEDICLELKDTGFNIDIHIYDFNLASSATIETIRANATHGYIPNLYNPGFEITINKINNKDFWAQIKDTVVRITEYSYNNGYSCKFFICKINSMMRNRTYSAGDWDNCIEIMNGYKTEQDFDTYFSYISAKILGYTESIRNIGFQIKISK